jgi:hypothetical protein
MDKHIEIIYNTYLRVSRQKNNKPFRYRKNFDDFEKEENYLPTLKLKSFFTRNPDVRMEDFFAAPYVVFSEEKNAFYDLKFYNSLQAIKVYSLYTKKIAMTDPDSDIQLKKIKDGFVFIRDFCLEKHISLKDYINFKTKETHDFLVHLSRKKISIYNLFLLKDFDKVIRTYDYELLSFILNDLASRISHFRSKFYSSTKAKIFCLEGLKKIEKIIEINLENGKTPIIIK